MKREEKTRMDNQQPIGLPTVQVSYRIFLRDMFPGFVTIIGAVAVVAPDIFKTDLVTVAIVLLAVLWSPAVGLMVNALGFMLLDGIVNIKRLDLVYSRLLSENAKRREELAHQIIALAYCSGASSQEEPTQIEQLFRERQQSIERRASYLLRVAGWSERDELIERIHAIMQSSRSMVFLCIVAIIAFANNQFTLPIGGVRVLVPAWVLFLVLGFIFFVVSAFAARYVKYLDLTLMHEMIVMGKIPISAIRGELPSPAKT